VKLLRSTLLTVVGAALLLPAIAFADDAVGMQVTYRF
jgi:hypothetical protein